MRILIQHKQPYIVPSPAQCSATAICCVVVVGLRLLYRLPPTTTNAMPMTIILYLLIWCKLLLPTITGIAVLQLLTVYYSWLFFLHIFDNEKAARSWYNRGGRMVPNIWLPALIRVGRDIGRISFFGSTPFHWWIYEYSLIPALRNFFRVEKEYCRILYS